MRFVFVPLMAFALGLPGASRAEEGPSDFAWYENTPMHLGFGILQNDLGKHFAVQCVEYREEAASTDTGAQLSTFEAEVVRDYRSLLEKMGIDATLSVHTLTSGAESAYREQRESFLEESSISVVIRARAVFADRILKDVTLRQPIRDLLKQNGGLQEAILRCGSKLVYVEHRGIQLNAVITLGDTASKNRRTIDASLGGRYGGGPLQGNAKIAFNNELATARKDGRVKIFVSAVGGDPGPLFKGEVEAALKDIPSLDEIGKRLGDYAADLSKKLPGVTGFSVAAFPEFDVAAADPWIREKEGRLSRLAELYRLAADKRDGLLAITEEHGPDPRHAAYTESELAEMRRTRRSADELVDKIVLLHSACKVAKREDYQPACVAPDELVGAVEALPLIRRLRPPSVDLLLAVRTGDSTDEAVLSPWMLADQYSAATIFESAAEFSPQDELLDHASEPRWTGEGIFVGIPRQVAYAQRGAYGVAITSEYLETVQVDVIADEAKFRAGYLKGQIPVSRYGRVDIADSSHAPSSLMDKDSDWRDGRRRYVWWIAYADDLSASSALPSHCARSPKDTDCKAWEIRQVDQIKSMTMFSPWTHLSSAVSEWIMNGKALSGKGRVRIRAIDRFAGRRDYDLVQFEWDVDEKLGIARITYRLSDSAATQRWFRTGLGGLFSHSAFFPYVNGFHDWFPNGGFAGASIQIPEWHDKWNELDIKYCSANIGLIKPEAQNNYAPYISAVAQTSTDRRTVSASLKSVPQKGSLTLTMALPASTHWRIFFGAVVRTGSADPVCPKPLIE